MFIDRDMNIDVNRIVVSLWIVALFLVGAVFWTDFSFSRSGSNFSAQLSGVGDGRLTSLCPYDQNGDGVINIIDLVTIARKFGQRVTADALEDVNQDGVVNIIDLVMIARQFGMSCEVLSAPGREITVPFKMTNNFWSYAHYTYIDVIKETEDYKIQFSFYPGAYPPRTGMSFDVRLSRSLKESLPAFIPGKVYEKDGVTYVLQSSLGLGDDEWIPLSDFVDDYTLFDRSSDRRVEFKISDDGFISNIRVWSVYDEPLARGHYGFDDPSIFYISEYVYGYSEVVARAEALEPMLDVIDIFDELSAAPLIAYEGGVELPPGPQDVVFETDPGTDFRITSDTAKILVRGIRGVVWNDPILRPAVLAGSVRAYRAAKMKKRTQPSDSEGEQAQDAGKRRR